MKEVIGVVRAVNDRRHAHLIYVSQEVKVNRKRVITGVAKFFTLDSEDGEEVLSTGDPDVFFLRDGTRLRRMRNRL